MVPSRYRVASRRRETPDTITLALEPVEGEALSFEPGQFDMLYVFGVGEVPISFSGARDGQIEHTVRSVGAVSRAISAARPGDVLGVRGPFGAGWGVKGAEGADIIVAGGGIGLAPLRPVIQRIIERRDRYGRVSILVGARSPEALLFRQDLAGWRSRFDMDVSITVDTAGVDWRGNVGLITELVAETGLGPNTVAFICGPEIMMRFVASALLDRGVEPGHVRLSMERNMKCAIGHCGHCQFGATFVCKDGPVYSYDRIAPLLAIREV
jgi:NAD(P)H-flavin reductase